MTLRALCTVTCKLTFEMLNYIFYISFYIIQRRKDLDYALINIYRPSQVTLSALSWRIDVCISTSALSRNLLPVIVIQTNLSDGKRVSFEMSLNSFNILRFNVALVLKEIEDVLNRQTFKILAD